NRINNRAMAAVQFWMLSEFIAEFIPVPFIDELLMPVVFLLDRRIFAYTQTIVIGKDLFQLSNTLTTTTSVAPQVISTFTNCYLKGMNTNASDPVSQMVINSVLGLVHWLGTPLGITLFIIARMPLGYGLFYVTCWFWGGFINYRLKKIYGWKFASRDFNLWEKGSKIARHFVRFDRRFRVRLWHASKVPSYWFYVLMFALF